MSNITEHDIDEEFLEIMNFFNGELPTEGIAKEMQAEVDRVKGKEDWRVEYMTMMELERQRYREGREEILLTFIENSRGLLQSDDNIKESLISLFNISSEYADKLLSLK